MKDDKQSKLAGHVESPKSPVDLWRLMGGKTQRVSGEGKNNNDSLLAVYKDRLTYTFILGREVASIHFDRAKREIFFRGHNIRNIKLDEAQIAALNGFKAVLAGDERGKSFLSDYDATLGDLLADNNKEGVVSR